MTSIPAPAGAPSSGTRPLAVAVDARYLCGPQGGIASTIENLLVEMRRQEPGLELMLVVRPGGYLPPDLGPGRIEQRTFAPNPVGLRSQLEFPWRVDLSGWPLYHAPHNFLPLGVRTRSVVTIHDVMWLQSPGNITLNPAHRLVSSWFFRRFVPDSVRRADHVIAVSRATLDALCRFVPEARAKATVIPNGVDPHYHRIDDDEAARLTADLAPAGVNLVACVGNGSPHKNHYRVVQAYLRAFGDRDDYRLVLVRRFTRWDRAMSRLLADPEVRRRVVVLPWISKETVRALYCRARIFFFPSWVEGFGLPILEAMACGCPVLTSDRSAPAEVAGSAALTVNPFDVDALARGLRRLDGDEGLRRELTARGRERAREFTWSAAAALTLEVYRRVLG